MGEEDETTYVELTVLEQINRQSFDTSSNSSNKTGADKDKWRWFKLCPRIAGSVLDCGKNSSNKYWQYLQVALLSAVVVVVLLLMLLPTIFYNLPLPVRYVYVVYVCVQYHVIVFSSTNRPFPLWYNSLYTIFCAFFVGTQVNLMD